MKKLKFKMNNSISYGMKFILIAIIALAVTYFSLFISPQNYVNFVDNIKEETNQFDFLNQAVFEK